MNDDVPKSDCIPITVDLLGCCQVSVDQPPSGFADDLEVTLDGLPDQSVLKECCKCESGNIVQDVATGLPDIVQKFG